MAKIYVKSQFTALHRWKDAPEPVAFLRNWHRHIFHVKVTLRVSHLNRDVEFFLFKARLDEFLNASFEGQYFELSCEQLAEKICCYFRAEEVDVSEDGENGGIVTASQLASTMQPTTCFYGREVEGPFAGSYVLFVPASCSVLPVRSSNALNGMYLNRIYYGAGNDRAVNWQKLYECIETANAYGLPLDVEVLGWDWAKRVQAYMEDKLDLPGFLISVVDSEDDIKERLHESHVAKIVDVQNEDIRWIMPDGDEIVSWLRHPEFGRDVPLY